MKTLSKLVAIIFSLLIALIILFNTGNTITLEIGSLSLKANVGLLIFSCVLLSIFATILFRPSAFDKNKLKKQIENTKLNHEIESDKVKQLQAKIDTLEAAIKAMAKKQ